MPDPCCLDTSALIAFYEDEPGADEVFSLLDRAENTDSEILFSFMSRYELLYLSLRENTPRSAELLEILKDLNIKEIPFSEEILNKAAQIKVTPGHKCSMADSWIAASASCSNATLYHKDNEMTTLEVKNRHITLSC